MSFLSAFVMVRDENPYLKPWIDFHLEQGFDELIIFDNASEIPVRTTIGSQYSPKNVRVVNVPPAWRSHPEHGPGLLCQKYMINHPNPPKFCWMHAGVDEFMFSQSGYTVRDIVAKYENSIKVPWRIFHDRDCESRLDHARPIYLDCVKSFEDPNRHCKLIANMHDTPQFSSDTHFCFVNSDFPPVEIDRQFKRFETIQNGHLAQLKSSDDSELVIAHYITMSKKEYKNKVTKGHSKFPGWTTPRVDEWDFWSAFEAKTDTRLRDAFRA